MSYQVTVQPSGRSFTVEDGQTIVDAAIDAHIAVPYACKSGACSTCKCKLVSGEVDLGNYKSHALTQSDIDNGLILTCTSTAKSDIVLEAHLASESATAAVEKMTCSIASLEKVAHDVMVVCVQLPEDKKFKFQAGQYIDLELANGVRRSYSIANAQHTLKGKGLLELHIRLVPGGAFTTHVFHDMKVGETLNLEGPLGTFFLRDESQAPIVFVVSGTGFAPVKAIIEHMQHRKIERKATLYWGVRQAQDLYLQDWLKQKLEQMPNLSYIPVASDAQPEDNWKGRTGFVHQAVMQDFPSLEKHEVYACGTPAMVDAAQQDFLKQCQLSENAFFSDAFTLSNS